MLDATVFEIPLYEDGTVPDHIEPVPISGQAAIAKAKSAFRNMSRPSGQHPGSVFRLPGVITVDKDLRKVVKGVNDVKAELKEFLQTEYPNSRTRNTFCKREFPGRVMLQAYRKIYVNERQIERVRFSWMPITRSTRAVSRAQALEMLAKRATLTSQDIDQKKAVEIAIEHVQMNTPNTQYSIIKPRSPYPTAVLYFKRKQNDKNKVFIPLSLPVIIGPTNHKLDIGTLSPLDTKKDRNKRQDEQPVQLVYKPMYLYAKLK